MNRYDLQGMARVRLREARALYGLRQYSGAYYLAGYSVECALKACIAKNTQRYEFPDKDKVQKSFTHKPAELLKIADLADPFRIAVRANPKLESSWNVVINWTEQSRYALWNKADARGLIDAVGRRTDGVLPWIKLHW